MYDTLQAVMQNNISILSRGPITPDYVTLRHSIENLSYVRDDASRFLATVRVSSEVRGL